MYLSTVKVGFDDPHMQEGRTSIGKLSIGKRKNNCIIGGGDSLGSPHGHTFIEKGGGADDAAMAQDSGINAGTALPSGDVVSGRWTGWRQFWS
jgi:hypothetical protein